MIDPIVQTVQAELILSEDKILVAAATEAVLNPRTDPVVLLLDRTRKKARGSFHARTLGVRGWRPRENVILDGARLVRRRSRDQLRNHSTGMANLGEVTDAVTAARSE